MLCQNKQLTNLRIFKDQKHNLESVKPENYNFGVINRKNKIN